MSTIAILFYLALAQELYFWWRRQPLPGPMTAPPLPPKGSGETQQHHVDRITTGTLQIQWNTDNTNNYRICAVPPSSVITFKAGEYDENVRAKITDGCYTTDMLESRPRG